MSLCENCNEERPCEVYYPKKGKTYICGACRILIMTNHCSNNKTTEEILAKIEEIKNSDVAIPRSKESLLVMMTNLLEWVLK